MIRILVITFIIVSFYVAYAFNPMLNFKSIVQDRNNSFNSVSIQLSGE